uniref:EOG090X05E6 n=1 Tax=Lynceus sp. MCZ IZ 141354 TaxID=1930659 RepID=A0A9N6WSQ3_9CRUS|nr:EOG090X05E6 [Lynceus sp. MCZ IZ 141354]
MTTFVDFYTNMLGFVNFRLYHSLNLMYPPKLPGLTLPETGKDGEDEYFEWIAALNKPLVRSGPAPDEDEPQIDIFPEDGDLKEAEELKKQAEQVKQVQNLFKGMKVFLSREVPRESLVFVIRACGGEVSWDASVFTGATFASDDESITHQIVDRPMVDKQYLSRYYVQPQWVYDCINFQRLLPVADYFIGATLPPHISPFVSERAGDYQPPERQAFLAGENLPTKSNDKAKESEDEENDSEAEDEEDIESSSEDEEEENENQTEGMPGKKPMAVVRGQVDNVDPNDINEKDEKEHYRFRELMIKTKHRKLYRSMMRSRKRRAQEAKKLQDKREIIEKGPEVPKKKKKAGKADSEVAAKKLKK